MAKNPPTASQNAIVIAFLLVLLSFAGIYFLLSPSLVERRTELETSKSKLAGLEADRDTLLRAKQVIASSRAELESKGVDFSKLNSVFPATEDMPGLYLQLEGLVGEAARRGVLAKYQVATPVTDPALGAKVPLTFTATGPLAELRNFVTLLETNTRPILLSTVTFANVEGSTLMSLTAAGYTLAGTVSGAYSSAQ